MFGEEFTEIPIVQVSIDASLSPEKNWEIGKAVAALRYAGLFNLVFCQSERLPPKTGRYSDPLRRASGAQSARQKEFLPRHCN